MPVSAIVLAGRRNEGAFREVSPAAWEALVEIAGRPMVSYVAGALREALGVGRVVVVGPADLEGTLGADVEVVEPGDSLVENLRRGFAALAASEGREDGGPSPVLVCGGDLPLLSGEAVDALLAACEALPAAVHYPVIEKSACEARYPQARRTYASFREGTFTGGNAFLIAPEAREPLLDLVGRFYAARKSPLRLARLLGPAILIKFLLRRLSVRDIERLFQRWTGLAGRAVVFPYPEVGMDVDKVEDLALAKILLKQAGR